MAEILPGVHQVEGVDPSPDFTTHVWLLRDPGAGWTLIDTGLPGSDKALASYLTRQGIEPKSIGTILLTHCHRDHVGALKRTAALTGAKIAAHWVEAEYIQNDPPYDGPGSPPLEAVPVDHKLIDGERLPNGGGLVAYHTPGHTPGHTAYFQPERKILFSGDLFFGDGSTMSLTPPEYSIHRPTALISARRVGALDVESVMSYHGGPFLRGGAAAIQKVIASYP